MLLQESDLIIPDWPVSPRVRAWVTTRRGGGSQAPFDSLNLGEHVGDDPLAVAANRRRLQETLGEAVRCQWLNQVHGTAVVRIGDDTADAAPDADGAVTERAGRACVVMTADCLPVLFASRQGDCVGAAHAGWRGLAAGVLEATLGAMPVPAEEVLCWLGPAIGPGRFEVGEEVRRTFVSADAAAARAFAPGAASGKWLADLYALARLRLEAAGVAGVYGGGFCTYDEPERFYSYRRDGRTGRMASLIWLAE